MNKFQFCVIAFVFVLIGVLTTAYSFKECGAKAFFLGNGGFYAAITGMCEEN